MAKKPVKRRAKLLQKPKPGFKGKAGSIRIAKKAAKLKEAEMHYKKLVAAQKKRKIEALKKKKRLAAYKKKHAATRRVLGIKKK